MNINGLNAPIKRQRIAEWIRKHDPHICCLQETHLRTKGLHRLKLKGWKQIFQANGQEKKSRGSNTHIKEKIHFKTRAIQRDPEGHFIILKGRIHQEDINIVNDKNHMIMSIDAEKAFDKIQHPFLVKTLSKVGI